MVSQRMVIASVLSTMTVALAVAALNLSDLKAAVNPPQSQDSASLTSQGDDAFRKALNTYCVTCHNEKLHTAGVILDSADVAKVGPSAELFEKVLRKLQTGTMPPAGRPRPDKPTTDALIATLQTALDRSATDHPNPGRTETFHRLNRTEYQNVIHDLLALDVDAASLLPADHATYGLDNMADALSVSPALLERYLSAARKISRLAIGVPPVGAAVETYRAPKLIDQDSQGSEDAPLGSHGGFVFRHYFPVDGEYVLQVRLRRQGYDYIMGLGEPHQLEIRLDGSQVARFTVGGDVKGRPAPLSYAGSIPGSTEWEQYALHADDALHIRVSARAGLREVAVSLLEQLTVDDGLFVAARVGRGDGNDEKANGAPSVDLVSIDGPYNVSGPGDTPSRRAIFVCRPIQKGDEEVCAKKILSTLARRAYRQPIADGDLATLLAFYKSGRAEGRFDDGIQFAVERILSDPRFLFRIERDPSNGAPGAAYRVSDLELASRLSFFIWSSVPDDALLDLAAAGRLHDPTILEQQVRRMLADPRSKALVNNFASQWLGLRTLPSTEFDPSLFPEFDESLRTGFQRETELFLESQISDNHGMLDLLTADYTYVNEQLAQYYGIPNVRGNRFRRVALSDNARRGLLGQGSILAVTSYPNRTSPVLRGKWVFDNLLGMPPPPPPPNIPALKERGEAGQVLSVRELLEEHRKSPVCASCHAPMDPLGFALENFDATGKWRTTAEGGAPVDASGTVPSGETLDGPNGLRAFLVSRREQVAQTITERLLAYTLGRNVAYTDMPAVRAILRDSSQRGYRWSDVILGIVKSTPFTMRTSHAGDASVTGQ